MERKAFKAKKSLANTYIGIPVVLIILLVITLTASGGDFYVGPGGVSILFLFMGIWYLNNEILIVDGKTYELKLSMLAKKRIFTIEEIEEIDNSNSRKIIVILKSNKKIKIPMNLFSDDDKNTINGLFKS